MTKRAVEIRKTYGINFWDACIVSNAEYAECDAIYSEDLNTGQFYSGIRIINPFVE
jgi:predicted nucleic acid-binding protein